MKTLLNAFRYFFFIAATPQEIQEKYYPWISYEDFDLIVKADPTSNVVGDVLKKKGSYSDWLLRRYKEKKLRLEDLYKATEYLEAFDKNKDALRAAGLSIDINHYPDLPTLLGSLEELNILKKPEGKVEDENDLVKNQYFVKNGEAKIRLDTSSWLILTPKSFEASEFYASGTRWCTQYPNMYRRYSAQGPLIIFIDKTKLNSNDLYRRMQFHAASTQFKDVNDGEVPFSMVAALSKTFPEFLPSLVGGPVEVLHTTKIRGGIVPEVMKVKDEFYFRFNSYGDFVSLFKDRFRGVPVRTLGGYAYYHTDLSDALSDIARGMDHDYVPDAVDTYESDSSPVYWGGLKDSYKKEVLEKLYEDYVSDLEWGRDEEVEQEGVLGVEEFLENLESHFERLSDWDYSRTVVEGEETFVSWAESSRELMNYIGACRTVFEYLMVESISGSYKQSRFDAFKDAFGISDVKYLGSSGLFLAFSSELLVEAEVRMEVAREEDEGDGVSRDSGELLSEIMVEVLLDETNSVNVVEELGNDMHWYEDAYSYADGFADEGLLTYLMRQEF